tara:strand:+ start:576 stop:815 length:240 start_codon:yes stop_codon:yes gene_type:complete
MFQQSPAKVENNRLRQALQKKGHGIRSAAREIGMSPADFCERLSAYDDNEAFADAIARLPKREPAKMRSARRTLRKEPV